MASRTFLGRYETVKLLGEGGMGRVYLAKQADLGRQVVVKVMHEHVAGDPKFRERFQREMLLMARFQHPYVVALYDASLDDPLGPCIVMEYVRGISLDALMRRNGQLSPARVGKMLGQVCEALYAAHSEGIIHRDLKPANLMVVDPDTPYEKIKVMDFGLAKLIEHSNGMSMMHHQSNTGVDFAVGTPGYISPEQVRGEETDYRCDIYGVGVMLFELLTGRLPFVRDETMDVLFAHATEPPPSFDDVGAGSAAPPEIEAIVMACLAKNPNDRPGSARELAESYQKALRSVEDRMEFPDEDKAAKNEAVTDSAEDPEQAKITMVTPPPPPPFDANVIVHFLEAWMPDIIATNKLKGFVQDNQGEVLENVPGRIKMRIGAGRNRGALSWFGIGRRPSIVDLELRLDRSNPTQQNLLHITVLLSSPNSRTSDERWRERCNEVFCNLRCYLAANVVGN
jgi:serine/threonine-protein kinase